MRASIAIIEPEFLVATGLRQCLTEMLPSVDVLLYPSVAQCRKDIETENGNRPYFVQFFVSANLLIGEKEYFRGLNKTIVALVGKQSQQTMVSDFPVIDVCSDEKSLWQQLLNLHDLEHRKSGTEVLTEREVDVLKCVARGLLNKEIADKLCISINTVISHRQHITEKTHLKSVAALTVYALMKGYVSSIEICI